MTNVGVSFILSDLDMPLCDSFLFSNLTAIAELSVCVRNYRFSYKFHIKGLDSNRLTEYYEGA